MDLHVCFWTSTVKPGSLLIDTSTIEPAVAQEVCELVQGRESTFLDAPVSGGNAMNDVNFITQIVFLYSHVYFCSLTVKITPIYLEAWLKLWSRNILRLFYSKKKWTGTIKWGIKSRSNCSIWLQGLLFHHDILYQLPHIVIQHLQENPITFKWASPYWWYYSLCFINFIFFQ